MKKKFDFVLAPHFAEILEPTPTKAQLPDWYKRGETMTAEGVPGMKTCVPFLDAMLVGYTLNTWEDVRITQENGEVTIEYFQTLEDGTEKRIGNAKMINERKGSSGSTIPRPAGFSQNHMVWAGRWGWKVPRGYSVLVTHPLNRMELPFFTLSGIVDSDGWVPAGNIPFFIQEGFNGVIPKGTPFAQLIPIKRDEWESRRMDSMGRRFGEEGKAARAVERGYYKEAYWHRKTYN